jgi:hypothetical protein
MHCRPGDARSRAVRILLTPAFADVLLYVSDGKQLFTIGRQKGALTFV